MIFDFRKRLECLSKKEIDGMSFYISRYSGEGDSFSYKDKHDPVNYKLIPISCFTSWCTMYDLYLYHIEYEFLRRTNYPLGTYLPKFTASPAKGIKGRTNFEFINNLSKLPDNIFIIYINNILNDLNVLMDIISEFYDKYESKFRKDNISNYYLDFDKAIENIYIENYNPTNRCRYIENYNDHILDVGIFDGAIEYVALNGYLFLISLFYKEYGSYNEEHLYLDRPGISKNKVFRTIVRLKKFLEKYAPLYYATLLNRIYNKSRECDFRVHEYIASYVVNKVVNDEVSFKEITKRTGISARKAKSYVFNKFNIKEKDEYLTKMAENPKLMKKIGITKKDLLHLVKI